MIPAEEWAAMDMTPNVGANARHIITRYRAVQADVFREVDKRIRMRAEFEQGKGRRVLLGIADYFADQLEEIEKGGRP